MEQRRGGMRTIGASLQRVAAPILGKQGIAAAQLVEHWATIVGDELAGKCWPVKLAFPRGERREGTLRLRALSTAAIEIQHLEPLLLERINGYFGYRAVARLALVQGPAPLPERPAPPSLRPLALAEQHALDQRLATIDDPQLRAALGRLGSAIAGRN